MAAIFPSAVATQLQLLTAQNNAMIVLDADCDFDDDILTVSDPSSLPDSGYLTFIDTDEVLHYTGKTTTTLTGVTRGADGTSAAGHLAGVDLEQRWNADYHNIVTLELVAVEQYLSDRFGIGSSPVVPSGKTLAVGGAADSKALLTLTSTTLGFLPPRMTTTQRDAIASPTEGLRIYNSSTHLSNVYDGTAWRSVLVSGTASIVNADVASSAAIAYSKLALTGAILNADLAGSIAYSKLTLTGAILNADLSGSIAYSKLSLTGAIVSGDLAGSIARNKLAALTASRAMVTDGSGFDSAATVTATELGYLSGVTSAIQTQIGTLLPLAGGTMTGAIAMGSHKITGLTAGSTSADALSYGQSGASLAGLALTDVATISKNVATALIGLTAGTTNATDYVVLTSAAGGGGTGKLVHRRTTGVNSSSPIAIANFGSFGLALVDITDGSNIAVDLVFLGFANKTVLASSNAVGSPPTRTYTISSGTLSLQLGSGSGYTCNVFGMGLDQG